MKRFLAVVLAVVLVGTAAAAVVLTAVATWLFVIGYKLKR